MNGHEAAPPLHAATRSVPPALRTEWVLRSTLVDRVISPETHLVVVSGPAGSGKSTLLAQAYAASSDAVWLSVATVDDDPAVLWSALIGSTAAVIPGLGEWYRHRLDGGGAEAVDAIIPLFVNELAAASHPIRFFLDDLHHLTGERAIASLQRLVDRLPAKDALVVASRAAAPFPLGRLRVERSVVEIGPADLAMDIDEARAAMAAAGVETDEDELLALVDRTEGWVAGLAWATLALQSAPETGSLVERIATLDRALADYLVEEVVDRRSPELRAFMLDTSILTSFNASLCNHMRGRDDSRLLLEELDRTNSFLVPLDRDGEWFRYHHLVHEVLAARLQRDGPSTVPTLHHRAAAWLSDHGDVVEGFRHARAAGDHTRAADILCGSWWEMLNGGRLETAHSLFEEFSHAEICGYQPLAIAAAAVYSLVGDHQRGRAYSSAARAGHFEGAPPDGSASIESSLAIMQGTVGFDGVDATLRAGDLAYRLEPVGSPWRPVAVMLVAVGHVWRGELDAAEPNLEEAAGSGSANQALVVYALSELALLRLAHDDVDQALANADAACSLATEFGLESVFVAALAHGAAAAARLAADDAPVADRHLTAAREPMAAVAAAMPLDAMRTRIVLADAALGLGRISEARTHVDHAARTMRQYDDTGDLDRQLEAVRARLDEAARTPHGEQLSERERAVLELMPGDMSIREIADALFVSKETVTTHRRQIYKKLSVTTRADAVVAARRAGLLPESDPGAA